jgi:hypothetical protein
MAVTKETYTATATWTAAQLATLFEDAFIDAGLMVAWYDSFLNTVENRILEVDYDGSKTYGKAYYWFMFTTGGVFLHVASDWDASTDVPTGTQYVDYFSTTTNYTTNHRTLISGLTPTTTLTLTRYTSAVNTDFSWFMLRNGTTNYNFHIPDAGAPEAGWLDLNKVMFHPIFQAKATTSSQSYGQLGFRNESPAIRRSYLSGGSLRGATNSSNYTSYYDFTAFNYIGLGNVSNFTLNSPNGINGIFLPTGFNNTNTAYATDSIPIFTGLNYTPYLTEALPSDFGVSFHFANNTMSVLDRLIVTPTTEEWEMLTVANAQSGGGTSASPMFLARVV